MMTVITYITLKEGAEPEWDGAMRARLENARNRAGWVRGEVAMPLDAMQKRVIVGTWETRADWEAWHEDPAFAAMRAQLDDLQVEQSEPAWYEVVSDVTAPPSPNPVEALVARARWTATKITRRKTTRPPADDG
jgi:heme-degrading monooxygenase HmoA